MLRWANTASQQPERRAPTGAQKEEYMLDFIKVVILGIVEGITEWLPISSTGHMILVEQFLKLSVSEDYWNMFLVVIQLGAILAVVFLYWGRLWPFHSSG